MIRVSVVDFLAPRAGLKSDECFVTGLGSHALNSDNYLQVAAGVVCVF